MTPTARLADIAPLTDDDLHRIITIRAAKRRNLQPIGHVNGRGLPAVESQEQSGLDPA